MKPPFSIDNVRLPDGVYVGTLNGHTISVPFRNWSYTQRGQGQSCGPEIPISVVVSGGRAEVIAT